ncbi:MAG: adenylate/guanylate cyclase domain-containing protein [Simkaniaceae bacterium]|nr:adenylate/guanylate cyclase domain-containing protein [Simkaniaceae bacterium]MCF7851726.1 adenylate/guanylate cyclase domain-containing protein [Simkaniaceae bacterium]
MKIRTKIFLLVGGIFLFSFLATQVVEELLTLRMVHESEAQIEAKINEQNEQKRRAVESYTRTQISESKAQVGALLNRIKDLGYWKDAFKPSDLNLETNTWLSSATLLINNKWLDLIQNLHRDKLLSLIILDEPPPFRTLMVPLIDEIKISVVDSQNVGVKLEGPFISIPFPFNELTYNHNPKIISQMILSSPQLDFYLLFDPEVIANLDLKALQDNMKQYQAVVNQKQLTERKLNFDQLNALAESMGIIYESMAKAKYFLNQNSDILQSITRDKKDWFERKFQSLSDATPIEPDLDHIQKQIEDRYDEINMIWQMLAYNATGIYDYNPLAKGAPIGLCHFHKDQNIGRAVITPSVFYNEPVTQLSPQIYTGMQDRIFLGQTEEFEASTISGIEKSYLTLGIDVRTILQGLAMATEDNALLIVNNDVVKAYDVQGDEFPYVKGTYPVEQIQSAPMGTFTDTKGRQYYYISIHPMENEAVEVVLFNDKEKVFSLLNIATNSAQSFNRRLSIQMTVIGLVTFVIVFLMINILAKRMTKPIVILAESSRRVKEGALDKVNLPQQEGESKDEISDLYASFSEMIKGLKEKERVMGVLNKVVSPQIAEKILGGNIELGGEEKIVTVLFADIRHFTELTQNIAPSTLIKLLNHYMTILSEVVDEYEGVIDKYVGDEVMALFGAPLSSEESAYRAVECAIEMLSRVQKYNDEHRQGESVVFDIGIGIHTGNVVAGNMGAENRMNYTVLGANVNLAARLCSAADSMQILISKETLESFHVKENIVYEELSAITLKGFSQPIAVFQVKSVR